MGADGWIDIFDADKFDDAVKKYGIECEDFPPSFYEHTLFGHRLYAVYDDTIRNVYWEPPAGWQEVEDESLLDKWEVWT